MSETKVQPRKAVCTVKANQKWQKTGIHVTPMETVEVKQISGTWSINPQMGNCNADGIFVTAKTGYTYPGAKEGQLIGRIGEKTFPLGQQAQTPKGQEGELELCANDDMDGRYGAGFQDNSGEITFDLTLCWDS